METIRSEFEATIRQLKTVGHTSITFSNGPFDRLAAPTHNSSKLSRIQNTRDDIGVAVLHALCQSCGTNEMFIQFFLGTEHGWGSEGGGGAFPNTSRNRSSTPTGCLNTTTCSSNSCLATASVTAMR